LADALDIATGGCADGKKFWADGNKYFRVAKNIVWVVKSFTLKGKEHA